nr:unnamed protein product [Haemonchus contortus]
MLRVIIILVMLVQMSDCVECRIFQSISPWAATNVTAQYCTFVMPPPCTNLEYSEDEVLRYQHFVSPSPLFVFHVVRDCLKGIERGEIGSHRKSEGIMIALKANGPLRSQNGH